MSFGLQTDLDGAETGHFSYSSVSSSSRMVATCANQILVFPKYASYVTAAIIVLICTLIPLGFFIKRHLWRKKNFYGVEDKMDVGDVEDEVELIGHYDDEVKIVQPAVESNRGAAKMGTPARTPLRIMRKRRLLSKPSTLKSAEILPPQKNSPHVLSTTQSSWMNSETTQLTRADSLPMSYIKLV